MLGQDFSAPDPLQITFAPGMNESCAMVSIIDDDALEGDHGFTVSISMTVPPITIDSTTIEVTIEDNEGMLSETEGKWIVMLMNFDMGAYREGEYIHEQNQTLKPID